MEEGGKFKIEIVPMGHSEDVNDEVFELVEYNETSTIVNKIMSSLPVGRTGIIKSQCTFVGESTGDKYIVIFTNDDFGVLCSVDSDEVRDIFSDEVFSDNSKNILMSDYCSLYELVDYEVVG
jgi:hypothetical protein